MSLKLDAQKKTIVNEFKRKDSMNDVNNKHRLKWQIMLKPLKSTNFIIQSFFIHHILLHLIREQLNVVH